MAPFIHCKISEQVNDVVRSQVIYVNVDFISHAEYEQHDGVLRIIYTAPDHSNGWRLATLVGKEAEDALQILKRQ